MLAALQPAPAVLAILALALPAPAQISGKSKAPPHGLLGPFGGSVPFAGQDLRREDWTNLGLLPVRPMAISADDAWLYAANVHDSTLVAIDFAAGEVRDSWRVPLGPVSVGIYDGHPDGRARVLVVSQGSHVLAVLERFTGEYVDLVALPFEPADLLVDETSRTAWISCPGAGLVYELDLVTFAGSEHQIPAEHPLHLSFDAGGAVLVAPQVSGNGSKAVRVNGLARIVDLENPAVSSSGLPDEDLFRIDPQSGSVAVVARQTGTNLFAQGVNPVTGSLWQLNVEALNKDPAKQSEPAIRGAFAVNRLTITQLPAPGGAPVAKPAHTFVDLDDADPLAPGAQIDPSRTVGGPVGLAFSSAGYGLITGSTTDNVTVRGPSGSAGEGSFVLELDLPAGSIPRQALFDPATEGLILVHCFGTNRVETYTALGAQLPAFSFDLGFDPTPPLVRAGRELFHDAGRSQNNNLTCGTCHVDGRSDLLAWNLSNAPFDMKGPLVTQSFKGIDRLAPYHWRGERPALRDFNVAFPDLLGGALLDESPGGEFDSFQAYVFSLRETANPNQREDNQLANLNQVEANGLAGSALRGQADFRTPGVGQLARACVECHADPGGAVGDIVLEAPSAIPQRNAIDVAAFNELWRKEQSTVTVDVFGQPLESALLGSGFQHDGEFADLFAFMQQFPVDEQTRSDLTAFVRQFPSGVAPAIHRATLLDQEHPGAEQRVTDYFIDQAERDYVDLVAFGTWTVGTGAPARYAWLYDPAIDKFRFDQSGLAPVRIQELAKEAALGRASVLFCAVPPGNGQRAALDRDRDGLRNQDEPLYGVSPEVADSDGDGFPDGYEVLNGGDPADPLALPNDVTPPTVKQLKLRWVTARNASVSFETSEPATWRIDYATTTGAGSASSASVQPGLTHQALLTDLLPSTAGLGVSPGEEHFNDYVASLVVTDLGGLTATKQVPAFQSQSFEQTLFAPQPAIIGALELTSVTKNVPAGTLTASGTLTMLKKHGGPPNPPSGGMVAAFNVVVDGALSAQLQTALPQSFKQLGEPYTALPGPWVLTDPTDPATGATTWSVTVSGLSPGDEVVFNPVLVQYVSASYDPLDPDFGQPGVNPVPSSNYAFADTPAERRSVRVTF